MPGTPEHTFTGLVAFEQLDATDKQAELEKIQTAKDAIQFCNAALASDILPEELIRVWRVAIESARGLLKSPLLQQEKEANWKTLSSDSVIALKRPMWLLYALPGGLRNLKEMKQKNVSPNTILADDKALLESVIEDNTQAFQALKVSVTEKQKAPQEKNLFSSSVFSGEKRFSSFQTQCQNDLQQVEEDLAAQAATDRAASVRSIKNPEDAINFHNTSLANSPEDWRLAVEQALADAKEEASKKSSSPADADRESILKRPLWLLALAPRESAGAEAEHNDLQRVVTENVEKNYKKNGKLCKALGNQKGFTSVFEAVIEDMRTAAIAMRKQPLSDLDELESGRGQDPTAVSSSSSTGGASVQEETPRLEAAVVSKTEQDSTLSEQVPAALQESNSEGLMTRIVGLLEDRNRCMDISEKHRGAAVITYLNDEIEVALRSLVNELLTSESGTVGVSTEDLAALRQLQAELQAVQAGTIKPNEQRTRFFIGSMPKQSREVHGVITVDRETQIAALKERIVIAEEGIKNLQAQTSLSNAPEQDLLRAQQRVERMRTELQQLEHPEAQQSSQNEMPGFSDVLRPGFKRVSSTSSSGTPPSPNQVNLAEQQRLKQGMHVVRASVPGNVPVTAQPSNGGPVTLRVRRPRPELRATDAMDRFAEQRPTGAVSPLARPAVTSALPSTVSSHRDSPVDLHAQHTNAFRSGEGVVYSQLESVSSQVEESEHSEPTHHLVDPAPQIPPEQTKDKGPRSQHEEVSPAIGFVEDMDQFTPKDMDPLIPLTRSGPKSQPEQEYMRPIRIEREPAVPAPAPTPTAESVAPPASSEQSAGLPPEPLVDTLRDMQGVYTNWYQDMEGYADVPAVEMDDDGEMLTLSFPSQEAAENFFAAFAESGHEFYVEGEDNRPEYQSTGVEMYLEKNVSGELAAGQGPVWQPVETRGIDERIALAHQTETQASVSPPRM